MDKELTWDKDVDAVVTTPQSQWNAYQIAVANLNPELKQRNKRYQSSLNTLNILNNEKVNLSEAWKIMMDTYKEAMERTEDAAQNQMMANSANANIQAWWAISWLWGLAVNPWAAAQTRIAAQNQAAAQNATVRSNADQNIAWLYTNAAQIPSTLSNMSQTNASIDQWQAQIDANNRQLDLQESQAEANNKLTEAQANYYNNMAKSSGSSSSWWSSKTSSSNNNSTTAALESLMWKTIKMSDWNTYTFQKDKVWNYVARYTWDDWKIHQMSENSFIKAANSILSKSS